MVIISRDIGGVVNNIGDDSLPSESYFGVFIHAYRRKKNISRKQLSILWEVNEDILLRIEYGFGSPDELKLIFSKMRPEIIEPAKKTQAQ